MMLIAKDVAYVYGWELARAGIIVTEDALTHLAAALGAGLVCATHDTLHRSTDLLADPAVAEWLKSNPPTP